MAKKAESKTDNTKKGQWVFVLGLVLCGIAVFLFIAFLSFLFSWQHDQSVLSSQSVEGTIYNKSGYYGLKIANWWVGLLGVSALIVPLIFFLVGIKILRPTFPDFQRRLLILFLGMLLLSAVPSYLFYPFKNSHIWFGNGIGGTHGLTIVRKLMAGTGAIGAGMILTLLCILYAIFLTPKTIDILTRFYHYIINKVVESYPLLVDRFHNLSKEKVKKEKLKKEEKVNVSESGPDSEEIEITIEEFEGSKSDNKNKGKTNNIDSEFIIIRKEEEEFEDEAEESETTNVTALLNKRVEMEDGENVEEVYLPEHMLVGELYDPTRDLSGYQRPPVDLLEDYKSNGDKIDTAELNKNKDKIVQILSHYKIGIEKIFATVGPTVTLYEIVPKDGVRISQIKRLEDDIALRIAALGVRIIAPMPGKGTVGIEVPNERPDIVSMRGIIKSAKFQESKFDLPVALGKTILGEVFAFDLAKMPHLLVAGATGQGKSVGLNAVLTSLLYKKHPAELKIVMVDPKKVELAPYNKIEKHFLAKLPDEEDAIITDTQKVVYTLKSLCMEMDNRYDLLKLAGVRNVKEYNEKFVNRRLNPQKGHYYMPYIVLVIDEFADLIMTAGREIEEPIARLAQLARAIGIHLVIATQRPTTNIITGLIKANFPARIAFRVTSMMDSRTILDTPGANQLIGRGDMLVSTGAELIRVQCAFVDTPEVDRITDFIRSQPGYGAAYDLPEYVGEEGKDGPKQVDMKNLDEMFEDAAKLLVQHQQGSTSLIQRKLSLGYNRAGRIMDQLEAAGIVGPPDGSKARQVLISDFNSLDHILAAYLKKD